MTSYELRPIPPLPADAHKGIAGRVLCVAGSPAMPGAAVLATRAALRAGAGLVTVTTRSTTQETVLVGACPEAILAPFEGDDPHSNPDPGAAFAELFAQGRFHAVLIGPGLGRDAWARAALDACRRLGSGLPMLLDADALNLLSEAAPDAGLATLGQSQGARLITPHPGEAQRLTGAEVPGDDAGRRAFAVDLARRSGAIVCLKGPRTVVSDGERTYVNTTGNAGMATAGSGDVLAGVGAAYLAFARTSGGDRWDAFDALACAVRVHGRAGDLAAEALGPRAVTASDLVDHLACAQREASA